MDACLLLLCLLSTHAVRQDVDISVTGCFFFFVCTVTDFSAEDKASCVKFCTVFCWRPGQGISHLWELCSPTSPKSDESASARGMPGHTEPNVNISDVKFTLAMCHLWNIARRADLGSTYYVSHH